MKLWGKYSELALPDVHQGDTVLFWTDKWDLGQDRIPLKDRLPRLFSFAKYGEVSVQEFLANENLTAAFNLPFSTQAYEELQTLKGWLQNFELLDGYDTWNCKGMILSPRSFIAMLMFTLMTALFTSGFGRVSVQ